MMRLSQVKFGSSSRCQLGVVLLLGLAIGCSGRSTDADGAGGSDGGGGKASGGGTVSIPLADPQPIRERRQAEGWVERLDLTDVRASGRRSEGAREALDGG